MNLENVKNYIWLLNIVAATLGLILAFIPIIHHSELNMSSDSYLTGFRIDHYPMGDQPTYYEPTSPIYRIGVTALIIIIIGSVVLLMVSLPLLITKINDWSKIRIFSISWLFCGLLIISGIIYYYFEMNSLDTAFWGYWTLSGGILALLGGSLAVFSSIFREIFTLILSKRSETKFN